MSAIFASLRHFIGWVISAFCSRQELILENLALRQQLLALRLRSAKDCETRCEPGAQSRGTQPTEAGFNRSLDSVACIIVTPWQRRRAILRTCKL
jgi:hypothetical protein